MINIVVTNSKTREIRNAPSAIFSYCKDRFETLLSDKNEKIQLVMSDIIVTEVHSSINVVEFNFNNFKDVSTTKQIPSKLEDALRI